jgi:hypothetical protein
MKDTIWFFKDRKFGVCRTKLQKIDYLKYLYIPEKDINIRNKDLYKTKKEAEKANFAVRQRMVIIQALNYLKYSNSINISLIPFFKVINFYKRVPKKFERYAALIIFFAVIKQIFVKKEKHMIEGKCHGIIGKLYKGMNFSVNSKKYGFTIVVYRKSLLTFEILEYLKPLSTKKFDYEKQTLKWAKQIFKRIGLKMDKKSFYIMDHYFSFTANETFPAEIKEGKVYLPPATLILRV